MQKITRKLKLSEIGYYGKAVEALTEEELQNAFLHLAQRLYDIDSSNQPCE